MLHLKKKKKRKKERKKERKEKKMHQSYVNNVMQKVREVWFAYSQTVYILYADGWGERV